MDKKNLYQMRVYDLLVDYINKQSNEDPDFDATTFSTGVFMAFAVLVNADDLLEAVDIANRLSVQHLLTHNDLKIVDDAIGDDD